MGKIGKYCSILPAQAIPARIVIGATSHRKLDNYITLTDAIQPAIDNIRQLIPPLRGFISSTLARWFQQKKCHHQRNWKSYISMTAGLPIERVKCLNELIY
jgi:hypothetical protein